MYNLRKIIFTNRIRLIIIPDVSIAFESLKKPIEIMCWSLRFRVTEEYIHEEQGMGFKDLSMDKIMTTKIHGITAEYSSAKTQGSAIFLSLIYLCKASRVTPETIKEMEALRVQDLEEIVSLQIHRVSPDYVKELQPAGLDNFL